MTVLAIDIDGTLFDGEQIMAPSFAEGIAAFIDATHHDDLKLPPIDEIMAVVGIPIDEIFLKLFPSLSDAERQMLNSFCNDAFVNAIRSHRGKLFAGAQETVVYLARDNYQLHVASNGRQEYIEAVLETYGLMGHFSSPFIYLNDQIRDKTALVKEYCNSLSGDDLLVMIGDRFTDREAAEENDVPFIACEFGHAADELAGCRYAVQHFNQIPAMVKRIEADQ